jgi:hypothetical protein
MNANGAPEVSLRLFDVNRAPEEIVLDNHALAVLRRAYGPRFF